MGKASSAKKIKKVQQAGVSRAPGQRRNMGYPALITGIVVVGLVLTFFAREQYAASASEAPVANRDHWHAAFGIDACGAWEEPLGDAGPDAQGIHTHADGLIHIHPFVGAAAGDGATFSVFAEQVGIELGDGEFTLPDGRRYANGDDCEVEEGKVEEGRVALYVWPPQATDATDPEIHTKDLGSVRFERDGQIFVLAFVPEDADVSLPPSVPELAAPSDLEAPSEQGSTEFTLPPTGDAPTGDAPAEGETTDTTAPADASTTVPPETTAPSTTAAGG